MLPTADKGNSVVILPTLHYENRIEKFLSDRSYHKVATGPTNAFQIAVRITVKQSKSLILKDSRWKYINMKPSAPSRKDL